MGKKDIWLINFDSYSLKSYIKKIFNAFVTIIL